MILRIIYAISSQLKIPNFVLLGGKIDVCGQTTNFRLMRPMPFNCTFNVVVLISITVVWLDLLYFL